MKKLLIIGAMLSAFSAQAVLADQPSFTYIEGGYSRMDTDGFDEDANGYILRGSADITDIIYLNSSYSNMNLETNANSDVDLKIKTIGLGLKFPIGDRTAIFTEANYLDAKTSSRTYSDTEDGYELSVGLRSMVSDSTELYGKLTNTKFDSNFSSMTVGAKQYFTDNIGVFAEYTRNDFDTQNVNVGVSYKF